MIYIDTGAFLARYLTRDQHHERAAAYWNRLGAARERCLTSSYVLDETITLLGRRAGYGFAAERARNLYASSHLTILRPDDQDEQNALDLFEKFADQKVSFTDCISFVLMTRASVKRVFTFDPRFERAGFRTLP